LARAALLFGVKLPGEECRAQSPNHRLSSNNDGAMAADSGPCLSTLNAPAPGKRSLFFKELCYIVPEEVAGAGEVGMHYSWGRRSYPISVYIAAIAVGILIPFILFVMLLISQLEMRERRALENRARETSRAISHVVERRLNDMATTLGLLSSSIEIRAGDLRGLHNRTQAALAGSEWYVIAVDQEGQQLLNTRVPFGSPLGKTSNMDALQSALTSREVTISDVFYGRTSQEWVFNVVDPISDEPASPVAALVMTQNAADLSALVSATPLPPNWSAAIVDGGNRLVAASSPSAGAAGEILQSDLLEVTARSSGSLELTLDGQDNLAAVASLAGGGWKIVLWGPIGEAQQSIVSTWRQLLLGGSALAILTGFIGYTVARKVRWSVRQLSTMAKEIGDVGVVSPVATGVSELDAVAVTLSEASFDRDTAERKVFLIMRELVHRTKNMLTVVQSMMRQTAHNKSSIEEFLPAVSERIVGLAHSIDLLTKNDWGGVSLEELIRTHLAPFIVDSDRVATMGDDVLLTPDAVQNLGMVIHELATNAVKYGALANVTGRVDITWYRSQDGDRETFKLSWTESGGPGVRESPRRGFGTTVIEKHAASAFRGKVSLQLNPEGLRWELVAPLQAIEWDGSTLAVPNTGDSL
jgi:two-component sensor histidine kinase